VRRPPGPASSWRFATEAVTALPDYLFHTRGRHRVAADCDPRNLASVALLERVGMRREAHHRRSAWWKGEWTDEFRSAVPADEWTARRPAPRA
jgi:aminoglycoside 6'-N-acetyltransferase